MTEIARAQPPALSDMTGSWKLDPSRTTIQFRTKSMWVRRVTGSLRAAEGDGAVDDGGQVTGRLVVDTESIDTGSRMRDTHLRGADFFEVSTYPAMVFEVTGAHLEARGRCTIEGALTVRGVTRPVEFQAAVRIESDGAVTIDARTAIDRSEWGMTWAKMGAGRHNEVTVKATFVRRDVR
jgi:polyisoprenoid-binding protein YceI